MTKTLCALRGEPLEVWQQRVRTLHRLSWRLAANVFGTLCMSSKGCIVLLLHLANLKSSSC